MTGPFKGLVTKIVLKKIDNFENDSRHDGTDGNRNDPGDEHTAGDAPMDGADAFSWTDTHDGARYDVSRTDRQMKEGGRKDDDGRVQIRRKAIDRFHLEDLRPHRRDDTPAAGRSP